MRRKIILDRATFRITLGQSLGIFAPNGTGKTTLINMMAGTIAPDEGIIRKTSRVSFPLGPMGGVSGGLSARDNARIVARLYGLDPDYVESFTRYLTDIDEYFDQPMSKYSSGMGARFRYALLLAIDFDIYLIDEGIPSTTDANFNRKAGNVLADRLRDSTVVIVSHDDSVIKKFCDRAAVLRDGRLYFFDTVDEAKQLYDWEQVDNYGG